MPTDLPYQLQPLRMPPCWEVTYNIWFEVDPSPQTMEWFNESMMLGLRSSDKRWFIDLTFSPERDPNGKFHVTIFDSNEPVDGGDFDNRIETVQYIEQYLHNISQNGSAVSVTKSQNAG